MVGIDLTQIGLWAIYIILPILALYLVYLVLTKAFKDMGFSSAEAVIIVFISFLFGFDIILFGFNMSNIYLFSYGNWNVGINIGGAVIPILLSIYLIFKKNLSLKKISIGVLIVAIITFFISTPVAAKGIVAAFPYWLLPAFSSSIYSAISSWKDYKKAAPIAYISGTIGVLIGADFLHLPELLSYQSDKAINAIIGGAVVFDMIFLTGILAVILDGIIMFRQKRRRDIS